MPPFISLQTQQNLNYLSQSTDWKNPYINSEVHSLSLAQEDQKIWSTPLLGKICCYYCGNPIQGVPYPKPVSFDAEKNVFSVEGVYCWFSCVYSDILANRGHNQGYQKELLTIMMHDVYDYSGIPRMVDKRLFEIYGGPVNHGQYLKKAASGEPMPVLRVRTGYPFVPSHMLIESTMKTIDFLQLGPTRLSPPSTIQEPYFVQKQKLKTQSEKDKEKEQRQAVVASAQDKVQDKTVDVSSSNLNFENFVPSSNASTLVVDKPPVISKEFDDLRQLVQNASKSSSKRSSPKIKQEKSRTPKKYTPQKWASERHNQSNEETTITENTKAKTTLQENASTKLQHHSEHVIEPSEKQSVKNTPKKHVQFQSSSRSRKISDAQPSETNTISELFDVVMRTRSHSR